LEEAERLKAARPCGRQMARSEILIISVFFTLAQSARGLAQSKTLSRGKSTRYSGRF
jgi:hypothetical protein